MHCNNSKSSKRLKNTWGASTVVRLALVEMSKLKWSMRNVFSLVHLSMLMSKAVYYIISMLLKPLETELYKLYFHIYIIKTKLAFFSIQHGKTESTVRGFGNTFDYRSVQGVHHTIVAVWLLLQLLLKSMKLALVFLTSRIYFITSLATLAECSPSCWLCASISLEKSATFSLEKSLMTVVHHTIVAVKVDFLMGKCVDLFNNLCLDMAEMILNNSELTATCHWTSSLGVEHHSYVAAKMDFKKKRRYVYLMIMKHKQKKNPNFSASCGNVSAV